MNIVEDFVSKISMLLSIYLLDYCLVNCFVASFRALIIINVNNNLRSFILQLLLLKSEPAIKPIINSISDICSLTKTI